MEKRIGCIVLAIIFLLVLVAPVTAQDINSSTITITMTTQSVLEINLTPTNWEIGIVEPDTEYKTNPEKTWGTITNQGNCVVDTYIKGTDAICVDNPNQKWSLSQDTSNEENEYVLWYWIGWTSTEYFPITKTENELGYEFCIDLGINEENQKQFGLKLLTPNSFEGGRDMQNTITISAVAA